MDNEVCAFGVVRAEAVVPLSAMPLAAVTARTDTAAIRRGVLEDIK
jgi:hypothetical protein